jgi:hypothetical protein
MGSLLLSPCGATASDRLMDKVVAELQFDDADAVQVLASLHTDANGELFELELWKTDFNPLIRIPSRID